MEVRVWFGKVYLEVQEVLFPVLCQRAVHEYPPHPELDHVDIFQLGDILENLDESIVEQVFCLHLVLRVVEADGVHFLRVQIVETGLLFFNAILASLCYFFERSQSYVHLREKLCKYIKEGIQENAFFAFFADN